MYCIFSFKSRQEAIRLYETARSKGVAVSIISTPQFVYAGCGLSVKTDIANYQDLYNLFVSIRFQSFFGAYRVRNTGKSVYSERIL